MLAECAQFWWGLPLLSNQLVTFILSHEHISKMQLNNDSGVDRLLNLEGTSISHLCPFPPFHRPSPPPRSLFPSCYAYRLPISRSTGHKAVCLTDMGPGDRSRFPSEPGPGPPNAFWCISVQNFRIWCDWQQKPKSSFNFWRRQSYWRPHQPKAWGDVSLCP